MAGRDSQTAHARRRNAAIFASIVVVWLLVDQATKAFCESFDVGTVIAGPFFGVFDLALVHNTGAAWGMFGDMTLVLAVLSLVVCVAAALYLFLFVPDSSALCAVGLSLVVAGGIGNAIDRFANMYVIDFIRPVFIDFPVFNVADIGVTCGCVLFIVSLLVDWRRNGEAD